MNLRSTFASRFLLNPFLRALLPLSVPGLALANPTGGVVVGGGASIGHPDTVTTVIDQTTDAAAINWQSFNVGGNEFVVFNQPTSSSVTLNRVVGGDASTILGSLSANGRVFLVNPAGVLFGRGATVDVGGLLASTMEISNEDFFAGNYVFAQPQSAGGRVENQGRITTADGGFVVLAGAEVRNAGLIQARLGEVVLAGGSALTLDFDGSGLVGYEITQGTLAEVAGVSNIGEILAQGGRVVMEAHLARELIGTVVNNEGLVRAQGITESGGDIILAATGGDVLQAGTLDVSASNGQDAGSVRLAGDRDVGIANGSLILATGSGGGELRAVAGGTLTYEQGASIDVARTSAMGDGGYAELSGHERVFIRDTVHLGEQGRLLIDPPTLTIGGANDDIPETVLESQLQTGGAGSQVQLAADTLITVRDLADGVLDGINADPAYGGGLLLGIGVVDGGLIRGTDGSILFEDQTDILRVEGTLDLISGSITGDITSGGLEGAFVNVQSAGFVDLGSAAVIAANGGSVNLNAGSGRLVVGNIGAGFITLSNQNGTVRAGNLSTSAGLITVSSSNADAADDGSGGPVSGIQLGTLAAFDGLSLSTSEISGTGSGQGIVTGDIQADGFVSVSAASGDVDLGSIVVDPSPNASQSIGNVSNLFIDSSTGNRINTGSLSVTGGNGGAQLSVNGGSLFIDGDITVSGGGGTVTFFPELDNVATALLQAAGDLAVSGNILLTGNATRFEQTDSFGSFSQVFGGADLLLSSGGDVGLQGDLHLSGVGAATAQIDAQGDVSIDGTTGVSALAGSQDSSFFNSDTGATQSRSLSQGVGGLKIGAGGAVITGDVAVDGDSIAAFDVLATTITLGDADPLSAVDVRANQTAGVTAPVDQQIDDGQTLLDSSFGLAVLNLDTGTAATGSISINGPVVVAGPVAGAGLYTLGDIDVGGDLVVTGSGYTLQGDSDLLFLVNDFRIGIDPSIYPQLPLGPLLDSGSVSWGGAGLRIGARDPESGVVGLASDVLIGGDLIMTGIGEVLAEIGTVNLSLATTSGPGDISMEAIGGQLLGSRTDLEVIDGNLYEVTRNFDNGAGGAANYGHAGLRISTAGGDIDAGNLSLLGLSARVGIDDLAGGGSLSLGNVSIGATDQAGLTRQRLVSSYADSPEDEITAPPLASTSTVIDGNLNGFEAGYFDGPLATVSTGDIAVSGVGFTGLAIGAGITQTGLITLSAIAGEFSTDDLRTYGESLQSPLGDVAVVLGVPGGAAAQIAGLSVSTDNALHLGLNVLATGAVDLDVGGALSQQLPELLTDDPHPLDRYEFEFKPILTAAAAAIVPEPKALITLPDSVISASRISLSLGAADTQIGGLSLSASDAVQLGGGGGALSFASDLVLAGATVSLTDLTLAVEGNLSLTASGADPAEGLALEIRNARIDLNVDAGNQLLLEAQSGGLSIVDSDLEAAAGTIEAAGDVEIRGSFVEIGLALSAGTDLRIIGSSLFALEASPGHSFDAGGAISVEDSQVAALSSLSMIAGSGSLQITNSALSGPASAQLSGTGLNLVNTSLLTSVATLSSSADLLLDAGSIAASFDQSGPATPAQSISLSALGSLSVAASGLSADSMSLSGGNLRFTNLGLSTAGQILVTATGADPAEGSAIELVNLSFEAGEAIALDAGAGSVQLNASTLRSAGTVTVSGAAVTLLSSTLDSAGTSIDSSGPTLMDNSLLIGDLQLISAGDVDIVNGTVMDGSEGSIHSAGNLRISGAGSGREPILRFGSLLDLSAGGDLVIESAALGPGQARAAGGGNLFLAAGNLLTLQDANLQGGTVGLQGDSIQLRNAFVGGGPVRFLITDPQGDLSDGGTASFIDADSLLVKDARNILLGASSLSVGSGQTEAGTGDAAVLAALLESGIAPAASNPNAAFLATDTLSLGSLSLTGDYLMLRGDTLSFGEGGLQAPGNLVLQFLPGSSTASVSLENLRSALGDVNYGVQDDFPSSASDGAVVVIGGGAFDGDIVVGRNGSVVPPAGTDLVLFTSGDVTEVQATSRDSGQVIIIGNLIIPPRITEPTVDEIAAVQSEVTPAPPVEPPVFGEVLSESELIEQHTAEDGVDRLCP